MHNYKKKNLHIKYQTIEKCVILEGITKAPHSVEVDILPVEKRKGNTKG